MDENFISYASDILGATVKGLTGSEISKEFTKYSMKFKRPVKSLDTRFAEEQRFLSKRDTLKENLMSFKKNEIYFILNELCQSPKFIGNENVNKLHIQLIKDYPELNDIESDDEKLDIEIIAATKHWLEGYKAQELYLKGIEVYKLKGFERNILDDLRLSLEILLREIFNNEKSFENQFENIGKLITKAGGSKEYTNMFVQLINYYSKYQNTYVKHNDKVNPNELEFIMEITSLFMKNLIKFHKSSS